VDAGALDLDEDRDGAPTTVTADHAATTSTGDISSV
jgi:hypothetical protein